MTHRPWMKFYTSDWRADPALRMCSISARGLWMEIICVMHEAEPYGSLRVNGRPVTERQLAALSGATVDDVVSCLSELEGAGVFSRDSDGVIYSRRMQRDNAKEAVDRLNGASGGNPKVAARVKGGVNPPVNPPVNPTVKGGVTPQKPEARSQNISYAASARAREDAGVSGAPTVLARIGELYAALGVTDETKSPGLLAYSEPIQWVASGCDIDADILPALRSIAARGKTPRSWAYCTESVFEAKSRRLSPAPSAASPRAPPVVRNAGQLARQQLAAMSAQDATGSIPRHNDAGDAEAGVAGSGIARRVAIASG